MGRMWCYAVVAGLTVCATTAAQEPEAVLVRASGQGEFVGADEQPIAAALKQLGLRGGGVVVIEAGRYVLHDALRVPAGVTMRGESGAVLVLPAPTRVVEAQVAGQSSLRVAEAKRFRAGKRVQVVPPQSDKTFADGQNRYFNVAIKAVDGDRLRLAEPLPVDVPAESRVGYDHHALEVRTDDVTIEHLAFDGGARADLPMPGHADRCGVWAEAHYVYEQGPIDEPVKRLTVRHCTFENFYGRGVSMYNVIDSQVIGCRLDRIYDEAINLDHFTFRIRAIGNTVRRSMRGIVLNDAGDCRVAHNRLIDCGTGIHMFWWHKVGDYPGVNRDNRIEHNTIAGSKHGSITAGPRVWHNTFEFNYLDQPPRLQESENFVRWNTLTER